MTSIKERILTLRELMRDRGWDAAVISGSDPHSNEYLPDHWNARRWISGFTGSFGTVVVTAGHAGLWTDTRYFIQATAQLEGSGIELHKLRVPEAVDYPEWLATNLPKGALVGIDGTCMSLSEVKALEAALAPIEAKVESVADYLDAIWTERPGLPEAPVFVLEDKYAGESAADKLAFVRERMKACGASRLLMDRLDCVGWTLNIRGGDIPYFPVAIAYLLVGPEDATLFIDPAKIRPEVEDYLKGLNVSVAPYGEILTVLAALRKEDRLCVDAGSINYGAWKTASESCSVMEMPCPVIGRKAVKNPVEIEGCRRAYIKDGVALTLFFHWIESRMAEGCRISEIEAASKLTALRAEQEDNIGESFATISAYGKNAALPHYSATEQDYSFLEPRGLYLVDSGGHYLHGTTDITRTIPLGPTTELEREDYTLVLKAMIALSRAVFLQGTIGSQLDMLCRQPLWKTRRNFGHGTGHGIGHVLSVHEGPQDIRHTIRSLAPIESGMITSNEPGMYREGLHGVRHENAILARECGSNEFGAWLDFETLTCCYFDTTPLVKELLSPEDIDWIKGYNSWVYESLKDLLPPDTREWLKRKTSFHTT